MNSLPSHKHLVKAGIGGNEFHKYLLSELLPRIGTLIESRCRMWKGCPRTHIPTWVSPPPTPLVRVHELCRLFVLSRDSIRVTHSTTYTFHAGCDITGQNHLPPHPTGSPTKATSQPRRTNECAYRDSCSGPRTWSLPLPVLGVGGECS